MGISELLASMRAVGGRLVRLVRRRRRLTASLLLAVATMLTLERFVPPKTETVPILVARADIPSGELITSTSVESIQIPVSLAPPARGTDRALLLDRSAAVPIRKGQIITENLLIGEDLLLGAPPGSSAVPLRLADPGTLSVLSAGQKVDVVLTSADSSEPGATPMTVANALTILWIQTDPSQASPWSTTAENGMIVVAAPADTARKLVQAQARVSVILVDPNRATATAAPPIHSSACTRDPSTLEAPDNQPQ